MKFHVLACDYDGTIAHNGCVSAETIADLLELKRSGRKLLLVTGREMRDLLTVFDRTDIFDYIVAENGAVLYQPSTRTTKLLGEAPPAAFVERLKQHNLTSISFGEIIIACWRPSEQIVLDLIRELQLEHQIIFNKGAVMILPSGINKESGLRAALHELKISEHNVVGVGDAENDHSFLKICECSAVVANALPALKERADIVLERDHGPGVSQLISMIMDDEQQLINYCAARHSFTIGDQENSTPELFSPYTKNVLIAGSSGAGKSTLATTILEGLSDNRYSFCIIDPEGDFAEFEHATALGSTHRPPTIEEIIGILESASGNASASVNIVGIPLIDRPSSFLSLFSRIQELRAKLGKPHWILVDEAHHVLPNVSNKAEVVIPSEIHQTIFITLNPEEIHRSVMKTIGLVVGVGADGPAAIRVWCKMNGRTVPQLPSQELKKGEVIVWHTDSWLPPYVMKVRPSKSNRRRHRRKYVEGELIPEECFYFRGPNNILNLKAQNLIVFLQIADGVDDATFLHHLKLHEYSDWIRKCIKDSPLADAIRAVESSELDVPKLKAEFHRLIEKDYTLPAKSLAGN